MRKSVSRNQIIIVLEGFSLYFIIVYLVGERCNGFCTMTCWLMIIKGKIIIKRNYFRYVQRERGRERDIQCTLIVIWRNPFTVSWMTSKRLKNQSQRPIREVSSAEEREEEEKQAENSNNKKHSHVKCGNLRVSGQENKKTTADALAIFTAQPLGGMPRPPTLTKYAQLGFALIIKCDSVWNWGQRTRRDEQKEETRTERRGGGDSQRDLEVIRQELEQATQRFCEMMHS